MGLLWRHLDCLGAYFPHVGTIWGRLGAYLARLVAFLASPGAILRRLGAISDNLGAYLARFFAELPRLGAILERFGAVSGRLGGILGRLGASWARLGRRKNMIFSLVFQCFCVPRPHWHNLASASVLKASWARLGSILGASWGHLGPSWSRLEASCGRLGPSCERLGAVLASQKPPKIAPRPLQDASQDELQHRSNIDLNLEAFASPK